MSSTDISRHDTDGVTGSLEFKIKPTDITAIRTLCRELGQEYFARPHHANMHPEQDSAE